MRPPKVEEQQLLEGLMGVLRSKGYDGASLNDLANSSGLKKASLYHRFPGGKKEITSAVLQYVNEWVTLNIQKILLDQDQSPKQRLGQVIININALYDQGKEICIIRALSMDTGITLFAEELKQGAQQWIDSFEALGIDFGFSQKEAHQKAVQVLINIQGGLVVAKSLGNTSPFQQAIEGIMALYEMKKM